MRTGVLPLRRSTTTEAITPCLCGDGRWNASGRETSRQPDKQTKPPRLWNIEIPPVHVCRELPWGSRGVAGRLQSERKAFRPVRGHFTEHSVDIMSRVDCHLFWQWRSSPAHQIEGMPCRAVFS